MAEEVATVESEGGSDGRVTDLASSFSLGVALPLLFVILADVVVAGL